MLKSRKFWAYEPSQSFEIKQEIFDNYKIKGRFFDDVLFFYDQMGIAPHPGLRAPSNREAFDVNSVNLINNKVDINTIKILLHLLPYTKIISLKLCSNKIASSDRNSFLIVLNETTGIISVYLH